MLLFRNIIAIKRIGIFTGFLSKDFEVDNYINNNGYLSSHMFDKIGWNSFSKIRNYKACLIYSLEYINKNTALDIPKGQHLYYCSRGLKRDNLICDYTLSQIAPIHYDFKSEFVFKTDINESQYYNFVTRLDNLKHIIYDYNNYT